MSPHLADVKKYDALADEEVVARIVKYLGIALRNRDSAKVACSDRSELDRVREKWCFKKLGLSDASRADAAIERVCETMASEGSKSRVTFYYLVAKHLGKLDAL
jgi:hypothetical protein